ncbi:MAG: 6-carboxytetrahydropterin synthase [Deltaproteobacteria bacterium]|nr:6-carboxytetrahydropterin synthase [Deltaproteobacteria bacterium]MBI3295370.1 6-carboxytetrahydropterin synthase [Deltaproteobacteria bacterium]
MRIHLAKKDFQFCAGHMTIFSAHEKERLHGHNYSIAVDIDLKAGAPLIPFNEFKAPIRKVCEQWDERVLLPKDSPYFTLESPSPLRFTVCGKRYELPEDEVILLPVDNVSAENLSRLLWKKLQAEFKSHLESGAITHFSVTISETDGQSATASSEK